MTTDGISVGMVQLPQPPLEQLNRLITLYESKGWDSIWYGDHFMGDIPSSFWEPELVSLARCQETPHDWLDPFTVMGFAAARTDRVEIGLGVTDPVRYNPMHLARAFLSLHHLSRGRTLCGIGPGTRMFTDPYGIDFERPVSRLEESLQIIRRAWETDQNETFDFDGEFWQFEDAVFGLPGVDDPKGPTYPDIFLAAKGPRMRSLTGRYADGWLPDFLSPTLYVDNWQAVEAAATDAGRDPEAITRGLWTGVVIDETREDAEAMLDTPVVKLNGLLFPPQVFHEHDVEPPLGVGQTSYVPSRLTQSDALELAETVSLEVIRNAYIWGTPEDVVSAIEEYASIGVDHIALANMTPRVDATKTGASFDQLEEVLSAVNSTVRGPDA